MVDNREELRKKLRGKLREIFQFEEEDLDFGIYRILNYKRNEIRKFIDKELIEEVKTQLELVGNDELNNIKNEFGKIKQEIENSFGEDAFEGEDLKDEFKKTPLAKKYYEKKKQLENIKISEDLERQVYNHIIDFFSRYYDKGDFISKRRYGKNEKYIVPYNGEEVLLYWANEDQYYIKTTEYFRKYTFRIGTSENITVNFRVVEAEEEKGNAKSTEKKYFVLNEKVFDFDEDKKELNIYFEYRGLTEEEKERYKHGKTVSQDKANEETIKILQEKIPENSLARLIFEKERNEDSKTLIEKHLYRYTRRNTTDYFIHRNLKKFLERELDFYIKNEFLNLDDLQVLEKSGYFDKLRLYLVGVRVFRKIALKIIDFLAQIEDFQKKLWEKKKFVIDTHYVITLDKIKEYAGEEFLESILSYILNNERQLEEWRDLFGIEVKQKEDLIDQREWKKLPLDTKYFDEEFKWKLLVALSENNDLDEILDGVLIKSENFQALSLLLNKYREKVQTIYIDPPYNTGNDDFLYKDNYQHSSWLTMMEDRLKLAKDLMKENGIIFNSIDYNEFTSLNFLYKTIFNYVSDVAIKVKAPSGVATGGMIFDVKEGILIYTKGNPSDIIPNNNKVVKEIIDGCSKTIESYNLIFVDEGEEGEIVAKLELDNETIEIRKHKNYKIKTIDTKQLKEKGNIMDYYVKNFDKIFRTASLSGGIEKKIRKLIPDNQLYSYYHTPSRGKRTGNITKYFVYKKEQILWLKDTAKIIKKGKKQIPIKLEQITNLISEDLWQGIANEGKVKLKEGKKPEKLLKMIIDLSSRKEDLVLDFFLGSGTTTAVAHKLRRKWIGIEIGEYFENLSLKRMKHVLSGEQTGISKEVNWQGGGFFKYMQLEQYEDALENISFDDSSRLNFELPDYFAKYILKWETRGSETFLNLNKLKNPFDYKLKIIDNYQQKTVKADVIETFNYLLGLNVSKYKVVDENNRRYVFVFGERENQRTAIVWRSIENIDWEEDKKVIEKNTKEFKPEKIYINGDAVVKGFEVIEPTFKSLMFKEVN